MFQTTCGCAVGTNSTPTPGADATLSSQSTSTWIRSPSRNGWPVASARGNIIADGSTNPSPPNGVLRANRVLRERFPGTDGAPRPDPFLRFAARDHAGCDDGYRSREAPAVSTWTASLPGSQTSSSSRRATQGLRASRTPAFKAPANPTGSGSTQIRSLGRRRPPSRPARRAAGHRGRLGPRCSRSVWDRALSTARTRSLGRFRVAMTTETMTPILSAGPASVKVWSVHNARNMPRLLLGFDIGSSSIKAALVDARTGKLAASAVSPKRSSPSRRRGPDGRSRTPRCGGRMSWPPVGRYAPRRAAPARRSRRSASPTRCTALSWSTARGRSCGRRSSGATAGRSRSARRRSAASASRPASSRLLNSPGNFTASKLAWVKENEPEVSRGRRRRCCRATTSRCACRARPRTTPSGLSEGILWDFSKGGIADRAGGVRLPPSVSPRSFRPSSIRGASPPAASALGLREGIPVAYRAGDQPNNAFSLNVLDRARWRPRRAPRAWSTASGAARSATPSRA